MRPPPDLSAGAAGMNEKFPAGVLPPGPGARNSAKEALARPQSKPEEVFKAGAGWHSPGNGLN